jgi:hypothetical protein
VIPRDALDQVIRDLEAERARPLPRRERAESEEQLRQRTQAEQAEARRILYEETVAFDAAHIGESREWRRPLRAVS